MKLEELAKLSEEATAEPWIESGHRRLCYRPKRGGLSPVHIETPENLKFIVAARTAVPEFVSRLS